MSDGIAKERKDLAEEPVWEAPPTPPFGVVSADCQEDRDHPLLGQIVGGKFHVVSLLSQGAHGLVFKARQAGIDREVALKVLRPDVGADRLAEFKERFLREARLAGRLQHPHIVTIHDYGEIGDDSCFIALELLHGRTLDDVLQAGPLPVRRALPIFAQLSKALVHAHEHGILHRDIKPSNVFVSQSDFVKLFDFGLVKADMPHEEITDAGTFMGTPHYAAPEQIRGDACDARIDLYAMGVLMYKALTGRLPFRGTSWVSVVLQHLQDPVPPIASLDVAVPAGVAAIVERCLHKEPERRFEHGTELLQALEAQIHALDRAMFERAGFVVTGAPASGVVQSFDSEPTGDDGTLETGDIAPLTPMSTPTSVAPRARVERARGPHPALFAIACLAVGIVVLLAFATRPVAVLAPSAAKGVAITASSAAPAVVRADAAPHDVESPSTVSRVESVEVANEVVVAQAPRARSTTARAAPHRTAPVPASTVDATIATSRSPAIGDAWSGTWRGRARGRAVAFDLSVAADGALVGTLERRIGDVTQSHRVEGTVTAAGDVRIVAPDERDGTIYQGSITGKVASGDVLSDGKTRGRWSVAIE